MTGGATSPPDREPFRVRPAGMHLAVVVAPAATHAERVPDSSARA